jgi:phosphoadenosine phosphosulfate reductase
MLEIEEWQKQLAELDALERIKRLMQKFPEETIATSSFGIQSAVCLHLIAKAGFKLPVVFIDTGYLFVETYRYAAQLRKSLDLDLRCYCPKITPTHMEALYGRQWEQGKDGLEKYLKHCKIEPMSRAIKELKPRAWIAGLRRAQSDSRSHRQVAELTDGMLKLHPIIDWSDKMVEDYFAAHDLPKHPLEADGYVSVGDWHSTTKLSQGMRMEETRFDGEKRECGLHIVQDWKGARN